MDGKTTIKPSTVDLGYPDPIDSATGLCSSRDRIYVLFWAKELFHAAVLRRTDLSTLYFQDLPEVKDGHSILVVGKKLYVVSTGTNEVISYDIRDKKLDKPEILWRADDSGKDTHHVNSIIQVGDDVYVSAFGPKTGALWSSAMNGYIHNITRDIRIKEGIYHPHSLSKRGGNIYYCESSTKSFSSLDGPRMQLEGYTRGIGWLSDELVCISSSIGRRISKSTGLIANPADPGESFGKSGMEIRSIQNGEIIAEVDLSGFGPEIYEVLVLDEIGEKKHSFFTQTAEFYWRGRKILNLSGWRAFRAVRKVGILIGPVNRLPQRLFRRLSRWLRNLF